MSNSKPQPLGLVPSFGFGDRLGLATPGHIRALREAALEGKVAAVFAQQSIRELTRTNRTPKDVIDAAAQAVEEMGYTHPWGADADHLKTEEEVRELAAAGFTWFTADPSDHVNDEGGTLAETELEGAYNALFDGNSDGERLLREYTCCELEGMTLEFGKNDVRRAALVYWKAIQHIIRMWQACLGAWQGEGDCDFEVSVDETDTPTTYAAHVLVASELQRANVKVTSLAPRFVGSFEKGVDYRGDLGEFRETLKVHTAIQKSFGNYKISIHTGSDKFSLYPIFADVMGGNVHVKTAGTSYLEALRLPARYQPSVFRAMTKMAIAKFPTARASYHLNTDESKVPDPDTVGDSNLESRFLNAPEADDPRQVLHVAFGEILTHPEYGKLIRDLIAAHPEEYSADLVVHFKKHFTAYLI
jgi:tagaturonate epimerase